VRLIFSSTVDDEAVGSSEQNHSGASFRPVLLAGTQTLDTPPGCT